MRQRILVITGSRAEYGLLKPLLKTLKSDQLIDLKILVTGSHLSPDHGLTYKEIEADGFDIYQKVEILLSSDSPIGEANAFGLAALGIGPVVNTIKPDLVMVLGDRFEILAAVCVVSILGIPIAHIHGGEITTGSKDDCFRHAITKLSHIHFVSAEPYRERVIQMGESPDRVFTVGGLGVDVVSNTELLSRLELEKALGHKFFEQNLLVTFHPDTLKYDENERQVSELLDALSRFPSVGLIFTKANADAGGRLVNHLINDFVNSMSNAVIFDSLGSLNYLSCVALVDGLVGNSSSALLEAPTLKRPAVNIGDRQNGRLMSDSIINCSIKAEDICRAIETLFSHEFQTRAKKTVNPYGEAGASLRICNLLRDLNLGNVMCKRFVDFKNIDRLWSPDIDC